MGTELRRWLADRLPREVSTGERIVALEAADNAWEETRIACQRDLLETMIRRTGYGDAKQLGKVLGKLAARGIELRIPIRSKDGRVVTDKRGRVVYACKGHELEFRIPTEEECPALKLPPAGDLQSSPQRGTKDVKAPPPGPKAPPPGPKAPPSGGPLPLIPQRTSTTSPKSEPAASGQQRKNGTAPAAPIPADAPHLDDVEAVCDHLADAIQKAIGERPKITKAKWVDPARLLLDADGRTLEQVLAAIDWAHADSFWQGVITDPKLLRKHYAALRQKAAAEQRKTNGHQPYRNPENQDVYDEDF